MRSLLAGADGASPLASVPPGAEVAQCTLRVLLGLYLVLAVYVSLAAEISGIVTEAHDGDSLTLVNGQATYRIRLVDVDAPELKQPRGRDSRASLFHLCALKGATAETRGEDRYGRTLARVTCAGVDANAEQVRPGWAWVFVRFAPKDSPLHQLESDARLGKRGLWADDSAVPLWEWRREKDQPRGRRHDVQRLFGWKRCLGWRAWILAIGSVAISGCVLDLPIRLAYAGWLYEERERLNREQIVYVPSHGIIVDLSRFNCEPLHFDPLIGRFCYDPKEQYLIIFVMTSGEYFTAGGYYFHFCEIDDKTMSAFRGSSNKGQYFAANIRNNENFGCRTKRLPAYS